MTYIKKGFFLIVGTALMVILLLAAGGVHLLPEYVFKSLMENELWSAVGGMFTMMLLPGAVVGFAACNSRILGLVEFAVFVVCGFIGGLNLWWIITAVLLVLSYLFCIRDNVGFYDDLNTYDRISVLVPAIGATHFIEEYGLEDIFNTIGKIVAVILMIGAVVCPYFQTFANQNIERGTVVGNALAGSPLVAFGNTLTGVMLYHVFLPLCAVLCAKYLFFKLKLAKVIAFVLGGYNAYRGLFILMPILLSVSNGGATPDQEIGLPVFDNLFGIEACFLTAMLLGGIMCIKIALDKKNNFITKVCISEDGSSAVKCILMAALFSVLAYIISPVVIYVAWAIIALVFLILSAVAISAVPEGGNGFDWTWYNMRRNQGMSHNQAFVDAQIHASQKK